MADHRIRLTEVLEREGERFLFGGIRETDGEHVALHISGTAKEPIADQIAQLGESVVYLNDSGGLRREGSVADGSHYDRKWN